jgi:DNA helicase HerA-like ATPase
MARAAPVGRILGTEDATPLSFWVALAPEQYLQLDDVVVCERTVPGRDEPVRIAGVVTQVRARHEGARFDSDVFLISDGVLPADTVEAAQVVATRVDPEVYVPPLPGSEAHRATGQERDAALYFDQMHNKLPIGIGRDGLPMFVNLEFIDGTRGAHINISGISGVATKTTYAMFMLYGLFHSGVLGAESDNTKALIFNVKGEDLLFLDHENAKLDPDSAQAYRTLGMMPTAFHDVGVYAPPRRDDPNATPDVSTRDLGVHPFFWTIEDFAIEELLPFVFADAEDERQQYTMVVHNVCAALKRDGVAAGDGGWRIDGETLRTYRDLVDFIVRKVTDDDPMVRAPWAGPVTGTGTINAFVRRLLSSQRSISRLVRADVSAETLLNRRIDVAASQVTVVDLHNLDDRGKRFVVGVTLRKAFDDKERSGQRKPLLFVVLDELNKYAPRDGDSPIKEILLDVAERGRSMGIVLIGAQQTASEVERRIIANSSVRVVGRLDPAEATRPEYGYLPSAHQQRAVIAKPGTMFVNQPQIPVPLVVEFPFPSWATRPDERGANPTEAGVLKLPDDLLEGVPRGPRG